VSTSDTAQLAQRIAQRGREVMVERLRDAFAHQAAARGDGLDLEPQQLEQMISEAAGRAGHALWRRSLAQAAMEELGIDLPEALAHPALAGAEALVGVQPVEILPIPVSSPPTPPSSAITEPQALRIGAVHLSGIETLKAGDSDIELRLSDAGLDVLKRSTGGAIGRLEWQEIEGVELPESKRGRRRRRRSPELHVSTGRGQARFELPGLTDEERHEHLEPALARLWRTAPGAGGPGPTGAR
jgi:hypothetical protein